MLDGQSDISLGPSSSRRILSTDVPVRLVEDAERSLVLVVRVVDARAIERALRVGQWEVHDVRNGVRRGEAVAEGFDSSDDSSDKEHRNTDGNDHKRLVPRGAASLGAWKPHDRTAAARAV